MFLTSKCLGLSNALPASGGYNSRTILDTGWFGCWSVVSIGFLRFYIMVHPQKMHWQSPVDFHSRGIDGSTTNQVKLLPSYESWSFTSGRRFELPTCGLSLEQFHCCRVTAAQSPKNVRPEALMECYCIIFIYFNCFLWCPKIWRCVTRWMGLDCQAHT